MTLLKDLARAKATFQARTLATILTEGQDMKANLHDIEVLFQHQTDAAVCVRETEDGEDIWLPKSRCEIYPQTPVRGQYVTLTSDEAMLTEKGMV